MSEVNIIIGLHYGFEPPAKGIIILSLEEAIAEPVASYLYEAGFKVWVTDKEEHDLFITGQKLKAKGNEITPYLWKP